MALAVFQQRVGNVFGSSDGRIREDGAPKLMGKVIVEDEAIEIRAVVEQYIEVRFVGAVVQAGDQFPVLGGRGGKTKGISTAVIGGADQFGPTSIEEVAGA